MKTRTGAFTLLELLVVIGLVAALTFLFAGGLAGGGKAAALHSAQATVANLITAARTKAPALNRKVRLLVHADPAQPERYLRLLVLQAGRQSGASPTDWDTVQRVTLPREACVVPVALTGLVADATEWKRVSNADADLVSDLFTNQTLSYTLEGDDAPQAWIGVAFTPNGTLAALVTGPPPKGYVVFAQAQPLAPGTYAPGEPPLRLVNPSGVRGLVLSAYGVPALLNDRNAF